MITKEKLQSLVDYDELTGKFTWKVSRGCVKAGTKVGFESNGYLRTKIDKKGYMLHKLVFLFIDGFLPECDVDHIDGDKKNNKRDNLRLATRRQNAANAKLNKLNDLGIKNVRLLKDVNKYQVRIEGKSYGVYEDLELAELVAIEVRDKLYGEYARHI